MKTPRKIQHTLMSSDSVLGTLGSNPAFSKGRQLVSFRFENHLHISMVSCRNGPTRHAYAWLIGPFWQDTLDMYVCMYVCLHVCVYICMYVRTYVQCRLAHVIGIVFLMGYWVQVFSLILDSSVRSQWAFILLEIRFKRLCFKSCIRQRKTACLYV